MNSLDYATKCDELDWLLKRYCDRKKRQTKSLQEQLKKEVSANVELRKYISFLEGKLQAEGENANQLVRSLDDRKRHAKAALMGRERHLHSLAAELESRLCMVEQRERECAEFATALEERDQHHWAKVKSFQRSKALFEAGLAASKKTVRAELQHSRYTEDSLTEYLDDVPGTDGLLLARGCDLGLKTRCMEQVLLLQRDECAARVNLLAAEIEERGSLLCSFFRASTTHLNRLLAEQQERERQLHRAEDLLCLQQVDLAGRMRKAMDLQQDSYAHAEMQRKVLALQCRRVVRSVGDVVGSLSGIDVEAVMLELESRIQGILRVPSSDASNEYGMHKAAGES
ncbi:conserved hypothetical protein [Leishmania infantum JPCM5]|uniref:Uncharacterized protein n=2 Tax=Leishmania infantum TaxID=5671 RepID=A4IAR8_LEIIN|nr:conserved hypothetical protein [Leishmania infantum JPCM5]CAC9542569.1 hypothetical_protein_-_conserved [Leishmania infantum]CAM71926.1 conserved hypothetical protein [Leishmania infantum JPCM5]SUZ45848.1 hypothetical_protein_-_conserved [Leishmania infantum]|eukprot:XP_001468837.1 conserved hypothetical protein [Leishmania infantum JPCM5]